STYPPSFHRLSRGVFWLTQRGLGVRVDQLSPFRHIGGLAPAPVLLLTGEEDRHATVHDAQRLFEHCTKPSELWFVPRAGHTDVCEAGGELYRERILSFLEQWLFNPRAAHRSEPTAAQAVHPSACRLS